MPASKFDEGLRGVVLCGVDVGFTVHYDLLLYRGECSQSIDSDVILYTTKYLQVNMTTAKILRRKQVEERTGFSKSGLYKMIARGEFPRPIKLTERSVGWLESSIDEWIMKRVEASEQNDRPSRIEASGHEAAKDRGQGEQL